MSPHRVFALGRLIIGVGWGDANDRLWWVVDANGYKHTDILFVGFISREGYPRMWCLTLGPLAIIVCQPGAA